ncbi:MAG: hypothetical protein M0006_09125 [Magnetospirillum sp.]|nr:hypothetical protein [Magnetospirillum sp.]
MAADRAHHGWSRADRDARADDFARDHAHHGWGRAYNEMRADGVADARNLGQAIKANRQEWRERAVHSGFRPEGAEIAHHHAPVVISYADGSTSTLGGRHAANRVGTRSAAGTHGAGVSHGGTAHHYASAQTAGVTSAAGGTVATRGARHEGHGR